MSKSLEISSIDKRYKQVLDINLQNTIEIMSRLT